MSSENTTVRHRPLATEAVREPTVETCPECGGRIVTDTHETACRECGLISNDPNDSHIDYGPDWRSYSDSPTTSSQKNRDDPRRVGMPATDLLHDKGLSSHIGWKDMDAKGNPLTAERRRQVSRLRTWDERFRTKNSKERALKTALGEISRIGGSLGLSRSVCKQAARLFRSAHDADLLPGNSIEAFASASVYAAIRVNGLPRTLSEVEAVSRVSSNEVSRAYGTLNRELSLPAVPVPAADHLPRQVSALGLSSETERDATELLEAALGTSPELASGRDPASLAAAALYIAGLTDGPSGASYRTQEAIADAADTSTVTIRHRYQEIVAAVPWLSDSDSGD